MAFRRLIKKISHDNLLDDDAQSVKSLDTPPSEYSTHYVTFMVKIRLKDASGLAVRDASGSSDPYVKFKYKERVYYKSCTVYKCLNPVWEEDFSMLVDDITAPLILEVFDYDRFCTDDFMGRARIDLSQFRLFQPRELCLELQPDEDTAVEESLGVVRLELTVVPQTQEEKELFQHKSSRGIVSETQKRQQKLTQMWTCVVNVVLVEGKGLTPSFAGAALPDPMCKFKLGCEKYKSKVCPRTHDPKWIEQFDLHLYDGLSETLEVACSDKKTNQTIGKCSISLTDIPRDTTITKWYPLDDSPGSLLLLITISGRQAGDAVVDLAEFSQNDVRNTVIHKFDTWNTAANMNEIGQLTVKVFRAEDLLAKDLGGKSDPFAVVELVNTRLQTHTEYKTLAPQWNKLFTFSVKDIHTCLEITVYDEDPNNKFEFLGKVAIPLMSIRNCERRWYALKDKKLQRRVKGEILVELDLIWNPVRAAVRTFNPREKKYMEQDKKFKASLFRATVMELKEFGVSVVSFKDSLQSLFDWDSTPRSLVAFILFMLATYFFQPCHLPLILLALFAKGYVRRRMAESLERERASSRQWSETDSDDENDKTPAADAKKSLSASESTSSSLKDTLFSVQETLGMVQNLLVFICELLQRIRNTFNFTSPWLSTLAVVVLSIASLLLYLVPIRWIVMVWGVNKFTKKLRNPNFVDNNELLDYLSRVPCDREMHEWRELRAPQNEMSRRRGGTSGSSGTLPRQ